MSLAEVVATWMLALLLGFLALVMYATFHQLRGEARAAAKRRGR